jgi:cyclic pyranopterin phosphate synthase
MPEEKYTWLPKASILSFEEIVRFVGIARGSGVEKVRITGGEPLLRHGLPKLVEMLSQDFAGVDLALTTNAVLLARHAADLKEAGLGRITVSLDTLQEQRFQQFARSSKLADVTSGIEALRREGFAGSKMNAVIVRGFNDDEVADLLEFATSRGIELRYIEYMDVGGATEWSWDKVVSRDEILEALTARYGVIEPMAAADPSAPAQRYRLPDGRTFGIVASTTAPFCGTCDRTRLTADGMFYLCLYADQGLDLRKPLREGASDDEIAAAVAERWRQRLDRGAEERIATHARGTLYQVASLRADPHREMHTRGG